MREGAPLGAGEGKSLIARWRCHGWLRLLASCLAALPLAVQAQAPQPATAGAASADPDTLVLSDTLRYDDAKRTSRFTGNVVMTRGLMTLTADQLDLREDDDGYQHGVATVAAGKRVQIRQARPDTFTVIEAQGQRGEYNGKTEQIDMVGQAVVTRFICGKPFDTLSGQRVRYHQKTDTYEAYGDPAARGDDGRVRSLAMPRARINAAIAECRASQGATPGTTPGGGGQPAALRPAARPGGTGS